MKEKEAHIAYFLANDKLGAYMGARFVSLTETECVYEYDVTPKHFNPYGILHGGALYAVMDSCQGMLMHYVVDDSFRTAATGTATIKYLAPLQAGKIRVRTTIGERQNRKYFLNSVARDERGKEVAVLDEIWIGIVA